MTIYCSFCYCLEVVCNGLCIVSCDCLATNLPKGNHTLGKSVGFSECHLPKQLIIHVVTNSIKFVFFNYGMT